ncbi:MAG: hypothetical protein KAI99_09255, partial [Cyclobacteriaceae bacterium]|nr:hypothetical protein [Cyclobacteriaceae bacterium]
SYLFDNLLQIRAPTNASNILNGAFIHNIPVGKTPTFHTITYIIPYATNHDCSVICNTQDLLLRLILYKYNYYRKIT